MSGIVLLPKVARAGELGPPGLLGNGEAAREVGADRKAEKAVADANVWPKVASDCAGVKK